MGQGRDVEHRDYALGHHQVWRLQTQDPDRIRSVREWVPGTQGYLFWRGGKETKVLGPSHGGRDRVIHEPGVVDTLFNSKGQVLGLKLCSPQGKLQQLLPTLPKPEGLTKTGWDATALPSPQACEL